MVFSPVMARGMEPGPVAFAADERRVNVAVTRARDVLVVVADRDVSVAQDAPGLFSVTDGASVHVFSAAGATLDDIAVLLA